MTGDESLARDLHDDLGQRMLVHRLDLEWIIQHTDGDVRKRAKKLGTSIETSLARLRALVEQSLLPELTDRLHVAVTKLCEELTRVSYIQFIAEVKPLPASLEEPFSSDLFRIIQEATTNIVRHAHASNARIALGVKDGIIHLDIEDDGCGFENTLATPETRGIAGMRSRSLTLGGTFEVNKNEKDGTAVSVRIPVQERVGQ